MGFGVINIQKCKKLLLAIFFFGHFWATIMDWRTALKYWILFFLISYLEEFQPVKYQSSRINTFGNIKLWKSNKFTLNLQFRSFQPDIWRATSPNPYKIWAIPGTNQTEGAKDILFWDSPGIFQFPPGNSRQNKAPPLEIPKVFVRSFGNSKAKNQDPWKLHIIFSWSHLEISLRF